MPSLRVAYIPEHFSTPLFLSEKYGYFGDIEVKFVPVIEGTGRLIALLNSGEIDIAIGLTEGFVADIAKGNETYQLVDTYVESPLCWAISTGSNRDELTEARQLDGKKIGVSRIGSGSYIMSFVLGHKLDFKKELTFEPLNNFQNLRQSVNDSTTDAFMWEHFTSKKYYDNGEIKKIGEIYTPWPSWVITVNRKLMKESPGLISQFVGGINKGIDHFNNNHDEAIQWIADNLDYTKEDATEWLPTVRFNNGVGINPLDWESVVVKTRDTLKLAGVLTDSDDVISQRLEEGVLKQLN
jgi:ABC-type nitrate/sulfonate/bicarbonate transport system substrate-binding protein